MQNTGMGDTPTKYLAKYVMRRDPKTPKEWFYPASQRTQKTIHTHSDEQALCLARAYISELEREYDGYTSIQLYALDKRVSILEA